jgi:dienelactone hydrolase
LVTETNFSGSELPPEWKPWIDAMAPTLKDKLWAVRNAPPIAGKFPVVIYAPSVGSMAWENADLCEYLASHGYVVIASPDMGATTRSMTLDLAGLNTQAADISFLIGFARTLPDSDVSKVAVAGFSFGGLSNLLAASRDIRICVLVALDGSMRYYAGLAKEAGIALFDVIEIDSRAKRFMIAGGFLPPIIAQRARRFWAGLSATLQ